MKLKIQYVVYTLSEIMCFYTHMKYIMYMTFEITSI